MAKRNGKAPAAPIRDRIRELRRVRAGDLAPNPSNWRAHPKEQVAALRAVLSEVGYAGALLARERKDGKLELVDGHARAELDPDQQVPVLVLDVTEEEARKLLLSLDPIGAMAKANEEAVRLLLKSTEFDSEALSRLAASLVPILPNGGKTDPDAVPEIPKKPVSKLGTLWRLGEHRLLCGDSTKGEDVGRLMGGAKAVICATDPPYLVDYTGADRPGKSGKDWSGTYREIDVKDAEAFFANVVANVVANAAHYWWHAHRRASLIERIWESHDILVHQQIVWVKPTALHGYSFYPWQHEPCFFGWRRGHKPAHDGDNTHAVTSVWAVDWEGASRVIGNEHPTQKPVEIFARPVRKHTAAGDICYEPFSGSGSQLIACEQLNRRCYAMEICENYVDVAVRRWEEFTGKKAERVKR